MSQEILKTLTEEIEKKDLVEILALLQFAAIQIGEKSPILLDSIEGQTETFKALSDNIEDFSKTLNMKISNAWTELDSVNSALREQALKIKNSSMIKVDKEDYESLISIMESLLSSLAKIQNEETEKSPSKRKNNELKSLMGSLAKIEENTEKILNNGVYPSDIIDVTPVGSLEVPKEVLPKRKHRPKSTTVEIELFDKDKGTIVMIGLVSLISFLIGVGACTLFMNVS